MSVIWHIWLEIPLATEHKCLKKVVGGGGGSSTPAKYMVWLSSLMCEGSVAPA